MDVPLLEVESLRTAFATPRGPVLAVDGVSFSLRAGGTLALVGESGSGKSVTARSLLRLVPDPPGRIVSGAVRFRGEDLLELSEARLRRLRGNQIAMVFQEPMSALNPVRRVGEQIAEVLRQHRGASRSEAAGRAVQLLEQVGIDAPQSRARQYPHQLSGGMRQRVVIAMALACDPALLIADEPTTALDVTVQAQILELIRTLQKERGTAVLLITHDLAVVAQTCDEVAVMYAGRVIERAGVRDLFRRPAHPYTAGLLRALPSLTPGKRLEPIPGTVPPPWALPTGCRYRNRCERALDVCARVDPALEPKRPAQWAACHNPVPEPDHG